MLWIIVSLILFVNLFDDSEGTYGYERCTYDTNVLPGNYYPFSSENYPYGNYRGGYKCKWTFHSQYPIKMNCTINIPKSNGCSKDALSVSTDDLDPQKYCGYGEVKVVSNDDNWINVTMDAMQYSPGGKFMCTVYTVEEDCQCGWHNQGRIVGGNETGIYEYPMMAGLAPRTPGPHSRDQIDCGATIINNYQVITAAHCIIGRDISYYIVAIGLHNTKDSTMTSETKVFSIKSYVIHPQYDENMYLNDIAIVTIDGLITFNKYIGPTCLPFQHNKDSFAGNRVKLLGWGTQSLAGVTSNVLQYTDVSVITKTNCNMKYPNKNIDDTQLCTYAQDRDSCQMDSGGPVLWKNPTTMKLVLVGIISNGDGCGGLKPGINTHVGSFIKFIESNNPRGYNYCKSE